MSIVSLQPIDLNSDAFQFSFVIPDLLTIDFVTEPTQDILLHISIRQRENRIVLNSLLNGNWEDEIVLDHDLQTKTACLLTVTLRHGKVVLKLDSHEIFAGQWRHNLAEADRIKANSDQVQIKRGNTGQSASLSREMETAHWQSQSGIDFNGAALGAKELTDLIEKRFDRIEELFGDLIIDQKVLPPTSVSARREIRFSDRAALKYHKDVVISGGYLITGQSGSTPGLRYDLPGGPERVTRISLLGVETNAENLAILLANGTGAVVDSRKFAGPKQPTTITFDFDSDASASQCFVCFSQPQRGDKLRFDSAVIETETPASTVTPQTRSLKRKLSAPATRVAGKRAAGVASIPSRASGLQRVIEAMGTQVDELHVYLNGYTSVPPFLQGKREVRVYLSDEFDDRGDAGKFFGLHRARGEYYLTVDDDIAYPNDYVDRLTALCSMYSAPTGVHGSLMRFPVSGYYDAASRYVFHFRDKNLMNRRVHILGTGTVCLARAHISPDLRFPYRNMADIWLARYAAEKKLPLLCIQRDFGWMEPLEVGEPGSIFDDNNRSESTQALLVEAELKKFAPRLLAIKSQKPKIVIAIKTFNRKDYLVDCINSIVKTVSADYDPVLVVADDGSDDGTLHYLMELKLPIELHVLSHNRIYVTGQTNAIFRKFLELNGDFLFVLDDDVVFKKEGWMGAYYKAALDSGYHHLCHWNLPHYEQLCARRGEKFPPPASKHGRYPLVSYGTVENCMGALFTVTREVLESVGWADQVNFSVRGLWHIDYSARCCRAGYNDYHRFFDILDANDYVVLQNTLKEEYKTSIDWRTDEFKRVSTPEERQRRRRIVQADGRIYVSPGEATHGPLLDPRDDDQKTIVHKVNDVFDRVFLINLERRSDRLAAVDARLGRHGIVYETIAAVDGTSPEVKADWKRYSERWVESPAGHSMSTKDFLFGYNGDRQRVAGLERKIGGPAVRTPGAWAYAKTYLSILRRSIQAGYERILVLDDDVLVHQNFAELFDRAVRQLPLNWKVLQLGTMQYDWEWTTPYSENLYMPNGAVVGSHAVGYHADTLALAIEHLERLTLPYDIGPLHYVTRAFQDESYVVVPNLMIQDTSHSDINSSHLAQEEKRKAENIYRWKLEDYR